MTTNIRFAHPGLLIDNCVLINLYASQRMREILSALPLSVGVTATVHDREAKFMWSGPEEDVKSASVEIDLHPYIVQNLLKRISIESDVEQRAWIYFGSQGLQDGEATTGAIAYSYNWAIGVDEGKARNIFARDLPHLQLFTTQELVKHWVDTTNPSAHDVRATLRNIELRGNYILSPKNLLYDWWEKQVGRG